METTFLRYYTQGNKPYQGPDGKYYITSTHNQIALMEVPDIHIAYFLSLRCGCCNNIKSCFRLATDTEIAIWKRPE